MATRIPKLLQGHRPTACALVLAVNRMMRGLGHSCACNLHLLRVASAQQLLARALGVEHAE